MCASTKIVEGKRGEGMLPRLKIVNLQWGGDRRDAQGVK